MQRYKKQKKAYKNSNKPIKNKNLIKKEDTTNINKTNKTPMKSNPKQSV